MKYWLTGFLLTLSFNVLAEDSVIYRWIDDNNVVHFSQNQPATGHYTEIKMANSRAPTSQQNNVVKPIFPSTSSSKESASKKLVSDSSQQCEEAKSNLKTLGEFDRIRFVDKNGETQILDKAEQEEQITINKKIVDTYCKSSSAKK